MPWGVPAVKNSLNDFSSWFASRRFRTIPVVNVQPMQNPLPPLVQLLADVDLEAAAAERHGLGVNPLPRQLVSSLLGGVSNIRGCALSSTQRVSGKSRLEGLTSVRSDVTGSLVQLLADIAVEATGEGHGGEGHAETVSLATLQARIAGSRARGVQSTTETT